MVSKFVIVAVLASLSVAHGAKLNNKLDTNIAPIEGEARLIQVPILGTLIVQSLKVSWFLITSVFSLVGYKVTALLLAAKVGYWVICNSFTVVLGALAMLGFCKLTNKCSLAYVPQQVLEAGETLAYAARSLENGLFKYGNEDMQ